MAARRILSWSRGSRRCCPRSFSPPRKYRTREKRLVAIAAAACGRTPPEFAAAVQSLIAAVPGAKVIDRAAPLVDGLDSLLIEADGATPGISGAPARNFSMARRMPACELLLAVVELGTDNEKRRLSLIVLGWVGMTAPRFGRITPLQGDMLRFAGHVLSRQAEADITDEQRIAALKAGHAALVARVGRDLGYELLAWHALLSSDRELRGEYQHPYAWQSVRAAVERALADPTRERLLTALR